MKGWGRKDPAGCSVTAISRYYEKVRHDMMALWNVRLPRRPARLIETNWQ